MDKTAADQLNLGVSKADRLEIGDKPRTIPNSYPRNWIEHDQWMATEKGSKKPRAITNKTDNPYSWSDPENWASFNKAKFVVDDSFLDAEHMVFILDRDDDEPYTDDPDPCAYIDFDDARDPTTGKVHPWARQVIELARSYACISTGGSGVHIEVMGELPEDVTQIKGYALPEAEGFPDASIEVYDGKRVDVLSGERIEGTPPTATRNDALLEALSDFFLTDEDRTENAGTYNYETSYSAEEIEEMEVGDMQAVRDAVSMVGASDITLKSTKTEHKGDRYSWDPCWDYNSDSGTTLGYDDNMGIWIWRDGDKKINALDVVALEEGHIDQPGETLTGKDFINALNDLRERGANIPRLEPPEPDMGDLADIDAELFENDSTRSMRVFSAAIKSVEAEDVRIGDDLAGEIKRIGERHWYHEPTDQMIDTLQLVAYDEGLTDHITDRVAGRAQWIQLGHALRWRGAAVPQYKQ